MKRKKPLRLRKLRDTDLVRLKCGPGPNCKAACQAAIDSITAILRDESHAEYTDDRQRMAKEAIHPTFLEP